MSTEKIPLQNEQPENGNGTEGATVVVVPVVVVPVVAPAAAPSQSQAQPQQQNGGGGGQQRTFMRPSIQQQNVQQGRSNQLHGNNRKTRGVGGTFRTNSWTAHQYPNQQGYMLNGRSNANGSTVGGTTSTNLGRSYSMSSFHPPLCAYTPSPGVGFGAWAKGPPPGLGVASPGQPLLRGREPIGFPPAGAFVGGNYHHRSSNMRFNSHNSQLPFYYNPVHGSGSQPCIPGGSGGPQCVRMIQPSTPLMPGKLSDSTSTSPESISSKISEGIKAASTSSSMSKLGISIADLEKCRDEKFVFFPDDEKIDTSPVFRMSNNISVTHNLCSICCKKNGRLCTGCKHVAYCSEKCQNVDWKIHKYNCNPPVIVNKPVAIKFLQNEGKRYAQNVPDKADVTKKCDQIVSNNSDAKSEQATIEVLHNQKTKPKHTSFAKKKLEFRKKIAQLFSNNVESEQDSDVGGAGESSPVPNPLEKNEHRNPSPEPDGDGPVPAFQSEGGVLMERYTGMMLTRKEIEPCELVAAISPIMITCCNIMACPNPPDSVMCLNCTRWYQASQGYRCSVCRWPVCSVECEKSYLHSNFECQVFSSNKRLPPPVKDHSQFFNDAILIIRCLLLKSVDPPKYQELLDLIDVCKMVEKKEETLAMDNRIIKYLQNECLIDTFTTLRGDTLLNFINVIDVCSIVVQDRMFIQVQDLGKSYYAPKFVFPMKLYVTQDCIPNCKWSIKHSPKFEECLLRIHTSIKLPPLTYVTTCFNHDRQVIGSWFQSDLSASKFKNRCTCRRCRDPTECGSFFSAVRCECNKRTDNPDGYLLPKHPLSRDSDWVCRAEGCGYLVEAAKMRARIFEMHAEIHNVNTHEDFYALLHLKWRLGHELHKGHFLMLKISVICVMLFWGSVRGLPFFSPRYDFFISTIELAHEALKIYECICPGRSIQRARVLFQIQVAYAYKRLRDIRRFMEWGEYSGKKQSLHQQAPTPGYPTNFWELIDIQKEAHDILKTEPYGTMEYEMAVVLQEVIEDQHDLLSTSLKEVNLEIAAVYNLHRIYTRFSNRYYFPAVPIYEDKDIQEFEVTTGPCARHLVEKINFPY